MVQTVTLIIVPIFVTSTTQPRFTMAQTFPPGGTYFDTLKKSFTDVPIDEGNGNGIATGAFLEASESLLTLFDVLGSAAFKPVKGDMQGNIKARAAREVSLDPRADTVS